MHAYAHMCMCKRGHLRFMQTVCVCKEDTGSSGILKLYANIVCVFMSVCVCV